MYAFALASLVAVSSVLQEPAAETAQTPWSRLSRLAGGEWIASGEGAPPNFHRFWFGPGQQSIWSHTRNAERLQVYPKSEAVFFWHPGEERLRALSVSDGGLVFDQVLRWQGEILETELEYYVADNKVEFASRWEFDGEKAYDWSLFAKTPQGLSKSMSVRFDHSEELRPLPEVARPQFTPADPVAFLAPLVGRWNAVVHGDSKALAMGTSDFRFEAGGHCLIVQGDEADDGRRRPFQGMAFWHPGHKSVQYLQIDDRGELRTGTVRAAEDSLVFDLQVFRSGSTSTVTERWKTASEDSFEVERTARSADGRTQRVQLRLKH